MSRALSTRCAWKGWSRRAAPAGRAAPPSRPRHWRCSGAKAYGKMMMMTPAEPTETPQGQASETRCGFVGIIGAPNAGKSTLTNALVGTKVSIVSHKVQTTRAQIRGIALAGPSQLILVDTPGIFRPKRRLDRAMVDAAWGGAREADAVVVLVDAAKGIEEEAVAILEGSRQLKMPVAL